MEMQRLRRAWRDGMDVAADKDRTGIREFGPGLLEHFAPRSVAYGRIL
jgi:hypothetical protein